MGTEDVGALPAIRPNALMAFASDSGQRRMIALANEFSEMVKQREKAGMKKWIVPFGRGRHLTIEAWQYIGQRAGIMVQTVPELTVDIYNPVTGDFEGVRAVTEAIRLDTGEVITRAVQVCYADEVLRRKDTGEIYRRWDDEEGKPNRHAINGMAQTRSASRCHANALRFIAEIAGLDGTPAEEMDGVDRGEGEDAIKTPKSKSAKKAAKKAGKKAGKKAAKPQAETGGDGRNEIVGPIEEVDDTKTGTNAQGPWTRYGVKIGSTRMSTFDDELGAQAIAMMGEGGTVVAVFAPNGEYKDLMSLERPEPGTFDL